MKKINWVLMFWFGLMHAGYAQTKPNIVLILADDMGWGDVGVHRNPVVETPVLDLLARQGAQFDRFYVSPLCAPTRASLLTGRYHLRTGVASVTGGLETMRSTEVTLAEILKKAGYATGAFGKWHNGAHYPENPMGQGFDEFFGFAGGHWSNYFDTRLQHNGVEVPTKGYITDVLTDAAIRFMDTHKNGPFFCYIPYNAPHGPFQVPDPYFNKYKAKGVADKEAAVYGMVDNMDENIGRVLRKLDELNLTDNTIVVFLTDNGPNSARYNGEMKGVKGSVHEGGCRVPLFIRWPGKIKENTLVKPIAAHIDLLPTLVDLTGIGKPETLPLDGKSLSSLLRNSGETWPERALFTHVKGDATNRINAYPGAIRTSRYRFIRDQQADQLYDMLADPNQQRNIAAQQPEITRKFRQQYEQWFADVTREGIRPEVTRIGFVEAPVTELFAPDAAKEGHLVYFAKNGYAHDWFTGWQQTDDAAVWTIDIEKEGTYQFSLKYNCLPGCAGSIMQLGVAGNTLKAPISQSFVGKLYDSPDRIGRIEAFEKDWATSVLGRLSLPKGRHTLSVRGVTGMPVPFELKSVLMERLN